ncbi:polynucleotide 5'-hydroxyl-kinase NOL9 isoform X2 [Zootermopsis nevadensis]|uniref:polynucleotide 5'-hydroxyl-kinase NOL9 isoform X2 n=1 Tax=Zootermopsis nevadensis TaxID=136037 RepID=UPI000B8E7DED|nr:polynucleotide 5'-hydroxyl-kinase NOL9 isoform X2 [Zootermopsis nevadensis]
MMELHVRSDKYFSESKVCCVNGNWGVEDIRSHALVHKLPRKEQFLLLMKHPYTVYFKGRLCVSVLKGNVEVLGCSMSARTSAGRVVYSPKGSSMLSIETCFPFPPNDLDYEVMDKNLDVFNLGLSEDIIAKMRHRDCVILLEAPRPSLLEGYMKTLPPFMHLFTFTEMKERNAKEREGSPFYKVEEMLQCVFELPHTARHMKRHRKGPDWDETANSIIKESSCTVVCGGKGVGKSTFVRFLINRSLPLFGQVLCLDFDPGQPEFTIPGCVSAVIVKEPLLGPSFTHLSTPECMVFIGEVNISQCPAQYMESVQYVTSYCHSQPELMRMPWIVNTMGFNKGVGVDITTSVIRLLKPQHVIQIQSVNAEFNFPELLCPSYVCSYQNRFCELPSGPCDSLQYVLHTMKTVAEDRKAMSPWGMGAPQLREAVILSYLSQMVQPPKYILTETVPYMTLFSKVTLCVCHVKLPFYQILSAFNGNLVALCSYSGTMTLLPDDPQLPSVLGQQPVCPCLGFVCFQVWYEALICKRSVCS